MAKREKKVRVRLLTSRVTGDFESQQAGDVIEVGNDEAWRMVEDLQAEAMEAITKPVEEELEKKAEKKPAEKEPVAVKAAGRKPRGE